MSSESVPHGAACLVYIELETGQKRDGYKFPNEASLAKYNKSNFDRKEGNVGQQLAALLGRPQPKLLM